MVAERKVDIGFGGFTTMATARAEGKDLIVIHGVFSPVNMVFVREGFEDQVRSPNLKGKKLGVFGNTSSTTFGFLALLARKWHGIDLFNEKEVSIVPQPAPLLVELLGREAMWMPRCWERRNPSRCSPRIDSAFSWISARNTAPARTAALRLT